MENLRKLAFAMFLSLIIFIPWWYLMVDPALKKQLVKEECLATDKGYWKAQRLLAAKRGGIPTLTIERNIPIPTDIERAGLPLAAICIGDSFYQSLVEAERVEVGLKLNINKLLEEYGKETGKAFIRLRLKEGYRIWRTK